MSELGVPVANSADGSDHPSASVDLNPVGTLAVILVIGAVLVAGARTSAVWLLVAVAGAQALLAFAWVYGTSLPGRKGALVIATLASAAADVSVSVWPHGRLGTLLAVAGLALPAMFVHQLLRGAARVRIVESLSDIAVLVVAVSALPALIQLRHEFGGDAHGGRVVGAVVMTLAAALIVGVLVDMIMPAPRFDPRVSRGLLAVIASTGLGGSVGHLLLRSEADFAGARGAFVGAALGALVALFAVAVAFVESSSARPAAGFPLRVRPVLTALMPMSLAAPVAFLLCLAIRA